MTNVTFASDQANQLFITQPGHFQVVPVRSRSFSKEKIELSAGVKNQANLKKIYTSILLKVNLHVLN